VSKKLITFRTFKEYCKNTDECRGCKLGFKFFATVNIKTSFMKNEICHEKTCPVWAKLKDAE